MKISNENNWENLEMVEFKKIEKFWKFIKESNENFKKTMIGGDERLNEEDNVWRKWKIE